MKKFISLSFMILLIGGLSPEPCLAKDLDLIIHEYSCTEEGILIRYGVVNQRNLDRPNVSILLKVITEGKPLACKEIKMVVPKGADGTEINEVILEAECEGKSLSLTYAIVQNYVRYRIKEWLSGCP